MLDVDELQPMGEGVVFVRHAREIVGVVHAATGRADSRGLVEMGVGVLLGERLTALKVRETLFRVGRLAACCADQAAMPLPADASLLLASAKRGAVFRMLRVFAHVRYLCPFR